MYNMYYIFDARSKFNNLTELAQFFVSTCIYYGNYICTTFIAF